MHETRANAPPSPVRANTNRGRRCVRPIVGKAAFLAHGMDVEVLDLVDNMAYFKRDDCGRGHCNR